MFAICIESSHQRGMGHLFRALNLIDWLCTRKVPYLLLINQDHASLEILCQKGISHEVVALDDFDSHWETSLIERFGIKTWINDRQNTDIRHARNVKKKNVRLVTFDDRGSGAALADFHFAAMVFDGIKDIQGNKVFCGPEYLILNREIDQHKRSRSRLNKIIVTLGGTDTYGVTIRIVNILKRYGKSATVMTGPGFQHEQVLRKAASDGFIIKGFVPSLIEEFRSYDLAVTGGGITPFEANASGLPCIIVANELFEIPAAQYLDRLGSSRYSGYHTEIDEEAFNAPLDLEKMSQQGMSHLTTGGIENIFGKLQVL